MEAMAAQAKSAANAAANILIVRRASNAAMRASERARASTAAFSELGDIGACERCDLAAFAAARRSVSLYARTRIASTSERPFASSAGTMSPATSSALREPPTRLRMGGGGACDAGRLYPAGACAGSAAELLAGATTPDRTAEAEAGAEAEVGTLRP